MIKHLCPFLTTALCLVPIIVHAQTYQPTNRVPVADNTLGTQISGTNNNFNITGGLNRGQNLFHSFQDFSVPTGGAANFTNPAGNRSIITRVTGNLFSDINGLVNTNGANFFLINPNGVVFGTNARLNVGKAFVTSTASGIDFVDAAGRTFTFGVNRAGDAPLISIDPNVAFNPARLIMGGSIPGNKGIENYGTLQTNNPGQYIGLIGGNVSFNGGQIIAPGANVELGGLLQGGSIGFSFDNGVLFPANVERGNISLVSIGTSPSVINVESGGGGSVGIVAKDITLQGTGTRIRAGILAGLGSPTATAGDINLDAIRNVTLSEAQIFNLVDIGALGKGGNIQIATGNLYVTDGAQLAASTKGKGDAGIVKIIATGNISFDDVKDDLRSAVLSQVEKGAEGNAGGIEILTNNLSATNGAGLSASTKGKGDVGRIKITATGNISFDGNKDGYSGSAFSRVETGGEGKVGGIEIVVRNLSITNGGQLSASTYGKGDAGSIKITATGNVSFDGNKDGYSSAAFSTVATGADGKVGGIEIVTRNLSVTNDAKLSTSTYGKGDAGNIKITASGNVSFDSGNAFSTVEEKGAEGKGGGIEIITPNLSITNSGQLQASTKGKGNAGNIKIIAAENISFDGIKDGFSSAALSQVENGGEGKGGDIEIVTGNLSVTNGAALTASTDGKGDAGKIKIFATGNVYFDGRKDGFSTRAESSVGTGAEGKGGEIEIVTGNLYVTNGAALTASTDGKGNAGNIFLNSNTTTLNDGGILLRSIVSTGGNINLVTTDYLLLRNDSIIATDSDSTGKNGNGGNITISSPLIVALPGNNDITANAYNGTGGRVKIDSQGLFGIQYRPKGSPFTNDITSSSTFGQSGIVTIDTPGTNPGRDSTELPNTTTDASNQISQVCSANNRQNKLTVTGRGGLPPNANDPLTSDVVWQDARAASSQPAVSSAPMNPVKLAPPAVGWVFDGKGKVTLIAAGAEGQPTGTQVVCPNVVR